MFSHNLKEHRDHYFGERDHALLFDVLVHSSESEWNKLWHHWKIKGLIKDVRSEAV